MFKKYQWRLKLPPETVLERLDANLIGEDALRERMTERLEDQFSHWRAAERPMGRVRGNRFRMIMPRERLRNPITPALRGRVVADGEGSRIIARVGLCWKSQIVVGFLFALWLGFALPWAIIKFRGGERDWVVLVLVPIFNRNVLVLGAIFALFAWGGWTDVRGFVNFLDEQFRDDRLPDEWKAES